MKVALKTGSLVAYGKSLTIKSQPLFKNDWYFDNDEIPGSACAGSSSEGRVNKGI